MYDIYRDDKIMVQTLKVDTDHCYNHLLYRNVLIIKIMQKVISTSRQTTKK